ncbi:MAG: flagellar FlbD family protein [Oscillospiraceae bacterium]
MIILHKLNDNEFTINCDYIEIITENPDTTITLTNGRVYIAKESMLDIIEKCLEYKKKVYANVLDYTFKREEEK